MARNNEVFEAALDAVNVGEEVRLFWLSPVNRYMERRIKQTEDAFLEISANTEADTATMAVARTNYIVAERNAVWLGDDLFVDRLPVRNSGLAQGFVAVKRASIPSKAKSPATARISTLSGVHSIANHPTITRA